MYELVPYSNSRLGQKYNTQYYYYFVDYYYYTAAVAATLWFLLSPTGVCTRTICRDTKNLPEIMAKNTKRTTRTETIIAKNVVKAKANATILSIDFIK